MGATHHGSCAVRITMPTRRTCPDDTEKQAQAHPGCVPPCHACLIVRGGVKALEFYGRVFGATERIRFPGPNGTIAHAEIQIGDSVVMVEDESAERGTKAPPAAGAPGSPSFLYIYVEDV